MKEKIDTAVIALETAGRLNLFVLLSKDGTVNRRGEGSMVSEDDNTYVGKSEDPLFDRFMESVPEEILSHAGTYSQADPQGELCKLTLGLRSPDGTIGFEFNFGSRSDGPPDEIRALLQLAADLTDDWYAEQRKAAESGETPQA